MQTRINRSAQPSPAKALPASQIPHPPVDETGERSPIATNTFVDSLLESARAGAGNDPYNHTGRRSGR
jgi:hypothetical protein